MKLHRPSMTWGRALRWAPLLALFAALPSQAQYKVVGPDGKITYTDRPPTDSKATPIAARINGGAAASNAGLPAELRQVTARYPVTLYTTPGNCDLCTSARDLLRQRGVPFSERQAGPGDGEALERLSGGRDIPTLTIGSQTLRGLSSDTWTSYLDAAGYPRESRLPANYQYPAPTPITERAAPAAPAAQAPQATDTPATPAPAGESNPTGIKF